MCNVPRCMVCWQVFLKYLHVEQLNVAVNETAQRITACQKYVRGFTARRRYANMKQLARKCEEDMKLLNDTVRQLTDCLNRQQKELHDEDVRHQEEKLRAAEEEKRKLEEEKKAQELKLQAAKTVW